MVLTAAVTVLLLHLLTVPEPGCAKYDLNHLTQARGQVACGPIQDDEALALFSLVRVCRLRSVLEIGGLNGYSSRNFLQALEHCDDGRLYTVDINPVHRLQENHVTLQKDCIQLDAQDIPRTLDLVFFDCHAAKAQLTAFHNLQDLGVITDETILALHDTHAWAWPPMHVVGAIKTRLEGGKPPPEHPDGYIHQTAEREMAKYFRQLGFDVLTLGTPKDAHGPAFPFRHGLTICQKGAGWKTEAPDGAVLNE